MPARYEFWLTDDGGRRITLMKDLAFASYSRTVQGFGTLQVGCPYDSFRSYFPGLFGPDLRVDIWRSPDGIVPMRRDASFLARKFSVYQRTTDSVRMVEILGRSPLDILRRASVITDTASYYEKTDYLDDMMKAIVTDSFITLGGFAPSGEFSVDADASLGPTVTFSFFGRQILDILKDLKATSFSLNRQSSTNKKIYFDVVEGPGVSGGFGYVFRTYADLRGVDRSLGKLFSVENGAITAPAYIEDYLDQITEARVYNKSTSTGITVDSQDVNLSRWNTIQQYEGSSGTAVADMTSQANAILSNGAGQIRMGATFVNVPGDLSHPRSLYGVDWDMGDFIPVSFAGKRMTCEVVIVHVSIDESGNENIVGQTEVGM